MSKPDEKSGRAAAGRRKRSASRFSFEQSYPFVSKWVKERGWIEIGELDGYRRAMVRALDEGGLIWEGKLDYASLDDLLADLERGLAHWYEEHG
jgi:hypothetical protein